MCVQCLAPRTARGSTYTFTLINTALTLLNTTNPSTNPHLVDDLQVALAALALKAAERVDAARAALRARGAVGGGGGVVVVIWW